MTSIALVAERRKVIVGVDTHKHVHVAVAIDQLGARLGDLTVSADTRRLRPARAVGSGARARRARSGSRAPAATAPG